MRNGAGEIESVGQSCNGHQPACGHAEVGQRHSREFGYLQQGPEATAVDEGETAQVEHEPVISASEGVIDRCIELRRRGKVEFTVHREGERSV